MRRIGIVAYEMEGERTGVGRYLEGLLSGLAECDSDWQWVLFFKDEPFDHARWPNGDRFRPVFGNSPGTSPIVWEQLRLPRVLRRHDLHALFSPGYSLPPGLRIPSMVTMHDLSFVQRPREFSWKERWRRRILAARAVRGASRVLADTGEIANSLARTYGIARDRVAVVPLAVEAKFLERPADGERAARASLARLGIRPPYLLYAGTILGRRNLDVLIEAFARLAPRFSELSLVVAGANRLTRPADLRSWIGRSGVGDRIIRPGYVDEGILPALYRNAELSFYMSDYEGFGLPPLESLAAGTPAIVTPGLGLDDIWPDYPYRSATVDAESVAALASRALDDPEARRRIGAEGVRRMSELSWKRSAELFLAEVDKTLERR